MSLYIHLALCINSVNMISIGTLQTAVFLCIYYSFHIKTNIFYINFHVSRVHSINLGLVVITFCTRTILISFRANMIQTCGMVTFEPGERCWRISTNRRASQTQNISSVDWSTVNVTGYRRLLWRVYHDIRSDHQSLLVSVGYKLIRKTLVFVMYTAACSCLLS